MQTLRGWAAATTSNWAMTVGSVIWNDRTMLPEERLLLGHEVIPVPEAYAPGRDDSAGPKFLAMHLEHFRGVMGGNVGLLANHVRPGELAIFELHQIDSGRPRRPPDIEFLALFVNAQVAQIVFDAGGLIVKEIFLVG